MKSADIIFLIDATGSMSTGIEAVKMHIEHFVDSLEHPTDACDMPVTDWRVAICAYRDYEYDTENGVAWFIQNSFTRDLNALKRQLDGIHAEGGGDEPESLLDAIWRIGKISEMDNCVVKANDEDADKWRHHSRAARFVIVLTDASFHVNVPSAPGITMEDVMEVIESARLRLSIYAPEFPNFSGYDELSQCSYAEYFPFPNETNPVDSLVSFVSNDANFREVLQKRSANICHVCSHC